MARHHDGSPRLTPEDLAELMKLATERRAIPHLSELTGAQVAQARRWATKTPIGGANLVGLIEGLEAHIATRKTETKQAERKLAELRRAIETWNAANPEKAYSFSDDGPRG